MRLSVRDAITHITHYIVITTNKNKKQKNKQVTLYHTGGQVILNSYRNFSLYAFLPFHLLFGVVAVVVVFVVS